MKELPRLIEQSVPGSLRHTLLGAGRRAEPSSSAPRELTEHLLSQLAKVPAGVELSNATAPKLAAGAARGSLLLKLGAVGLVIGAGAVPLLQTQSSAGPTALPVLAPSSVEAGAVRLQQVPPEPLTRESAAARQPEAPAPTENGLAVSAVDPKPRALLPVAPVLSSHSGRVPAPRSRARQRAQGPASVQIAAANSTTSSSNVATSAASNPAAALPPPTAQDTRVDTRLQAELRCLDAVRRALQNGDTALAQSLLADYRIQFPTGYLAPEARRLAEQLELRAPVPR